MRNKTRIKIAVIAVVVAALAYSAIYHKGPWRGKVIDAETKKPIEGAAVVAVWWRSYAGPVGDTIHFFDATETLTDKNGEFVISSFWAVNVPFIREITGPNFTIFKPGYGSFPWHHSSPKGDISRIFLDKISKVALPPIIDKDIRIKSLNAAEFIITDEVPRKKIEKFLLLIDKENKELGFSIRRLK